MHLLELPAVKRNGLEYLGVFLSELAEGERGEFSAHAVDLGVGRGLEVGGEAKLQGLEPAEGEWSLEVAEAAIVDEEVPAVPEVVDEGLVKLLLAEVVRLQLYLDLVGL